jgi:anti-sigma factor RsiW
MKFQLRIASILDRALRRRSLAGSPECASVQGLLSAFMDSETSWQETAHVESHLEHCGACRQELDGLAAVRNFVASSEPPAAPEGLALQVRVLLSRTLNTDYAWRFKFLVTDFVKPFAIRAAVGASVTAVLFAVMLVGLVANQPLMASDTVPLAAVRQPVRPTEAAKLWLAGTEWDRPPEPLLIEAYVDGEGRAYDYRVIEGELTPEVDRWVWERLYYAQFSPETRFGVAVSSSIMLSFVAVQS